MHPFAESTLGLVAGSVFSALLLVAAIGDFRFRRIPNKLVAGLAVLGLAYSVAVDPLVGGMLRGASGLVTGLGIWLPFYALGWLGAGDVKLFAAAGAWLGPKAALEGAVVGAVAGALLALLWMIGTRGVRSTTEVLGMSAGSPSLLTPRDKDAGRSTLPYGVAMAFGALWAGWAPGLILTS